MAQQKVRTRTPAHQEVGKSRGHWNRDAHFLHRDYSPTLGRFIERDPIGFEAGDNNWYRFVKNQSSSQTDPSGLQAEPPARVRTYCKLYCQDLGTTLYKVVERWYSTARCRAWQCICRATEATRKNCSFWRETPIVGHTAKKHCWYKCQGFPRPMIVTWDTARPCPEENEYGWVPHK